MGGPPLSPAVPSSNKSLSLSTRPLPAVTLHTASFPAGQAISAMGSSNSCLPIACPMPPQAEIFSTCTLAACPARESPMRCLSPVPFTLTRTTMLPAANLRVLQARHVVQRASPAAPLQAEAVPAVPGCPLLGCVCAHALVPQLVAHDQAEGLLGATALLFLLPSRSLRQLQQVSAGRCGHVCSRPRVFVCAIGMRGRKAGIEASESSATAGLLQIARPMIQVPMARQCFGQAL